MSQRPLRIRRTLVVIVLLLFTTISIFLSDEMWQSVVTEPPETIATNGAALDALGTLAIKGRAPKSGYERSEFGGGWSIVNGCDMRNIILHRDMKNVVIGDSCKVLSGVLDDPYTGKTIEFKRGPETSNNVQIDHVVALSDAWQKGAQQLTPEEREQFANDPLELIAVDGEANQKKGDGDAATWLPSNKSFRCQYVARQIAVKSKYDIWVTQAEHEAMRSVLSQCPSQPLPAD